MTARRNIDLTGAVAAAKRAQSSDSVVTTGSARFCGTFSVNIVVVSEPTGNQTTGFPQAYATRKICEDLILLVSGVSVARARLIVGDVVDICVTLASGHLRPCAC